MCTGNVRQRYSQDVDLYGHSEGEDMDSVSHPLIRKHVANKKASLLGRMPCLAFAGAFALYVLVGLWSVEQSPQATDKVSDYKIPAHAECLRMHRRADFTVVELAIGTPPRVINVRFRAGMVVDDPNYGLHLYGLPVLESKSLHCYASTDEHNNTCFDVLLLSLGNPNAYLSQVVVRFRYTVQGAGVRIGEDLQIHGDMHPVRGYAYTISSTHICVSAIKTDADVTTGAPEKRLIASTQSYFNRMGTQANGDKWMPSYGVSVLVTNSSAVRSVSASLLKGTPVYDAASVGICVSMWDRINLFPPEAEDESRYLRLQTLLTDENQLSIRRRVVDLGTECVEFITSTGETSSIAEGLDRAVNIIRLESSAPSMSAPSITFRSAAHLDVTAFYHAQAGDGDVAFVLSTNDALAYVPLLADPHIAVQIAVMKLLTLFLAAAVMWVRSDRSTSSAIWLYRHHVDMAHCKVTPPKAKGSSESNGNTPTAIVEDAILGILACVVRITITCIRFPSLAYDRQLRVLILNLIAGSTSLLNWVVRFCVLQPNIVAFIGAPPQLVDDNAKNNNNPLARLGGSMAVVDVSCAVLLAFAEPPILDTLATFDETARILTGILIGVVTMERCLFAIACNALCYEAHHAKYVAWDKCYVYLIVVAIGMWATQTAVVSLTVADLVITPLCVSLTRTLRGPDSIVGVALFLVGINVAIPNILSACVRMSHVVFGLEDEGCKASNEDNGYQDKDGVN